MAIPIENVVNLTVFSKSGASLGEFVDAEFLSAMWRLGNSGMARYSIPRNGNKTTRANLQPGNRALIEFGDGLPNWGGVVDFPISYGSDSELLLTIYEGERLLDWRFSGAHEAYGDVAVGSIVQGLVETANAAAATGVYVGDIYAGGDTQSREFHYATLLDAIVGLSSESGYDYAVVPVKVGGKLVFDIYWYEQRGIDRRDEIGLVEGKNVGKVSVVEQGPILNSVVVVGKGPENWADKPKGEASDATSISRYGLREGSTFYFDISDTTTLQAIADALVETGKDPRVSIVASGVASVSPALFSKYGIGDIVHFEALHDWGDFVVDFPVRIHSRQRMADGTCILEVKKWEGD